MKVISIISVCFMMLLTACKKNTTVTAAVVDPTYTQAKTTYAQVDFPTSLSKFEDFKSASSNSYVYVVRFQSWTGMTNLTTITVTGGVVTNRSYKHYDGGNDGRAGALTVSWDEDLSNLGSHTEGAEVLTLDQVYDKAKNVWLKADTQKNTLYFATDINGLIMSCGYVPKGCADDCFTGINIASITALKK